MESSTSTIKSVTANKSAPVSQVSVPVNQNTPVNPSIVPASTKNVSPTSKICDSEIDKFIQSKNIIDLGSCYNQLLKSQKVSDVNNPVNNDGKCILVNSKKSKYYTHAYDPTNIISKINGYEDPYKTELLGNVNRIFDLTVKSSCCNCVSISLYFKGNKLTSLLNYLETIKRSVENIKIILPDWIVRIYLDISVYATFMNRKEVNLNGMTEEHIKILQSTLDYLFASENVEIYTFFCKDILENTIPIGQTRTFRFLSLLDDDVNVRVVREADGIVTKQDCHNINVFAKSNRIFFFSPISLGAIPLNPMEGYQSWLTLYKQKMEPEYFKKKSTILQILAGTFACRLTVKKDVYYESANKIQKFIQNNPDDNIILNTGYDEILLLHLFRDIVTIPYIIKNSIVGPEYDYDITSVVEQQYYGGVIISRHEDEIKDFKTYDILSFTDIKSTISKWSTVTDPLIKPINDKIIVNLTTELNNIIIKSDYIFLMYIFDALLDSNMIAPNQTDNMIDIRSMADNRGDRYHVLDLINTPYTGVQKDMLISLDRLKDSDKIYEIVPLKLKSGQMGGGDLYYKKYLKYKAKYLKLKT